EEIIAFEQGRTHRARRNRKRLEEQRADDQSKQQRLDDDTDGLAEPARFFLAFVCHAHVVLDYASMGIRGEAIWGNHNADSGKPRAAYRYGTASMMTNACAIGNSSVMVRWITAR